MAPPQLVTDFYTTANSTTAVTMLLQFNLDFITVSNNLQLFNSTLLAELQALLDVNDPLMAIVSITPGSVVVLVTMGLTAAQILQQFQVDYLVYANVTLSPAQFPLLVNTQFVSVSTPVVGLTVVYEGAYDPTCDVDLNGVLNNCMTQGNNPVLSAVCWNGLCGCQNTSSGACAPYTTAGPTPQPGTVCVSGLGVVPDVCESVQNTAAQITYIDSTQTPVVDIYPPCTTAYQSTLCYTDGGMLNYTAVVGAFPACVNNTYGYSPYPINTPSNCSQMYEQPVGWATTPNYVDECSYRNPRYYNLFPRRRFCQSLDYSYGQDSTMITGVWGDAFEPAQALVYALALTLNANTDWQISRGEVVRHQGYVSDLYQGAQSTVSKVWAQIEWRDFLALNQTNATAITVQLTTLTFLDAIEGAADRYYMNDTWQYWPCAANQYAYWDYTVGAPACDCFAYHVPDPNPSPGVAPGCVSGCPSGTCGEQCNLDGSVASNGAWVFSVNYTSHITTDCSQMACKQGAQGNITTCSKAQRRALFAQPAPLPEYGNAPEATSAELAGIYVGVVMLVGMAYAISTLLRAHYQPSTPPSRTKSVTGAKYTSVVAAPLAVGAATTYALSRDQDSEEEEEDDD